MEQNSTKMMHKYEMTIIAILRYKTM